MISSLVCLVVLGLAGLTVAANDNTTSSSSQIEWGPCDATQVNNTALSCGFLEVPLDYHDKSVGNARLALIKANATADRIGTVFFNPGGPGGSGLNTLSSNLSLLLAVTGGRFDVVSWDPRGAGLSTPGEVYCFDSTEDYEGLFQGTIELSGIEMMGNFTDPQDVAALLAQAPVMQDRYEQLGERCLQSANGKYLQYVGTVATVRDLAAIADAIEGPGSLVNYIGVSYGTFLGSVFINMFPERVGRVILDGVIDPVFYSSQEFSLHWSHQLVDADNVYKGIVTGCALAGPEGCAISTSAGQSAADIDAEVQELLQTAHDAARRNASVPVTSGQIRTQLFNALYTPVGWSYLVDTVYPQVKEVVDSEGESSQQTVSSRSPDVRRRALHKRQNLDNVPFSTQAIMCGDDVDAGQTSMEDVFRSIIAASQQVSPMFAAQWPAAPYGCSLWPVRAVERYRGPFNRTLANSIVVIGNTYDPATPFQGAQAVSDLLGDQAALVRLNAFGHTSTASPSRCIAGIVLAYLVNGTVPQKGVVCEADEDFELFWGVNTEAIFADM